MKRASWHGAAFLLLLLAGCGEATPDNRQAVPPSAAPTATVPIRPAAAEPAAPSAPAAASPAVAASRPPAKPTPKPAASQDRYRALGTEPFWSVRIRGGQAVLERPDHPPVRYAVREEAGDATILYAGEGFSMRLSPGPCSDGMSDALWSDRVQIAFAGGTLKGCGGVREEPR